MTASRRKRREDLAKGVGWGRRWEPARWLQRVRCGWVPWGGTGWRLWGRVGWVCSDWERQGSRWIAVGVGGRGGGVLRLICTEVEGGSRSWWQGGASNPVSPTPASPALPYPPTPSIPSHFIAPHPCPTPPHPSLQRAGGQLRQGGAAQGAGSEC